jgi:large subunit ribosomal protein L21
MFAVIKTGGKQHKVAAEDKVTVMALAGEPGDKVTFGEVLMLVDGDDVTLGVPFVSGASVAAEIVGHERGPKVIAFKKRRRKNSKRKRGHKQDLTVVRITGIAAKAGEAGQEAEAEPSA